MKLMLLSIPRKAPIVRPKLFVFIHAHLPDGDGSIARRYPFVDLLGIAPWVRRIFREVFDVCRPVARPFWL
jgi:hypothetical protein